MKFTHQVSLISDRTERDRGQPSASKRPAISAAGMELGISLKMRVFCSAFVTARMPSGVISRYCRFSASARALLMTSWSIVISITLGACRSLGCIMYIYACMYRK